MNKTVYMLAAVAAVAMLAASSVPTNALLESPPPSYICPLGYNPGALMNLCINPSPDIVYGNRTYCISGDSCAALPMLTQDGRVDGVAYVDLLCNGTFGLTCGCGHLAEGAVLACTPDETGHSTPEGDEFVRGNQSWWMDPTSCQPTPSMVPTVLRYNPDALANVCVSTDGGVSHLALGLQSLCILGGEICILLPVLIEESEMHTGTPYVYAEVACNQPQGCGCGSHLYGLLVVCAPIEGE